MKNTKSCPKCGSTDIVRIPDNPNRHASGNNIYTSTYTLFGKIPVIRYVCCSCGYAENWVENEEELEEIRQVTIKSLEMARDILGKGAFRKENNESKPINMNIFETTLYFMTLLPKNNIAVSREELLEKIKTVISSEEFLYYIGNSRDNTMKVYGRFQLMENYVRR